VKVQVARRALLILNGNEGAAKAMRRSDRAADHAREEDPVGLFQRVAVVERDFILVTLVFLGDIAPAQSGALECFQHLHQAMMPDANPAEGIGLAVWDQMGLVAVVDEIEFKLRSDPHAMKAAGAVQKASEMRAKVERMRIAARIGDRSDGDCRGAEHAGRAPFQLPRILVRDRDFDIGSAKRFREDRKEDWVAVDVLGKDTGREAHARRSFKSPVEQLAAGNAVGIGKENEGSRRAHHLGSGLSLSVVNRR
jgi:hypothetical protein